MPEALLLALPVVGGFLTAIQADRSRFRIARETGYRFYFRVVHYALWLVGASIFASQAAWALGGITGACVTGPMCSTEIVSELYSAILGSLHANEWQLGVLAFSFGIVAPRILNLPPGTQEKYVEQAIKGDDFEAMIAESLASSKAIAITLRSKQVYIGWAVKAPNPATSRRWLRILPLASGYRDQTRRMRLTVHYGEMVKKARDQDEAFLNKLSRPIHASDFEIVISLDEITGMHFFDIDVYRIFDADGASLFIDPIETSSRDDSSDQIAPLDVASEARE